ncbi:MAG TPA: PD-(D/E)XK nuclease family protein [Thermosynechococcaceae cyanobacterium]
MNLPVFPIFRLSQAHLNLLATCPRKFQHTYLEQLAAPSDPEQQERMSQGSRFHLLMQQWQLGLPVESIAQSDPQLQQWFSAFVASAAEILKLDDRLPSLAQSEHPRTLEFEGYLLTVVYDLLLLDDQQAKILDWKTYPRPRKTDWLLQNWQTRLYRFVLAETSSYAPEQVSMVYWFFQSKGDRATTPEPQSVRLSYDRAQHEQTRQDLKLLLRQLFQWLEQYRQGNSFPQVELGAEACERCSFAVRCDRSADLDLPTSIALPSFAEIQEVAL